MKYWVYILHSESLKRHYVGQTQDIQKRLNKHNYGYVKSTKAGKPWMLVYQQECETRSETMLLEKKIKGRGANRFLRDNNIGMQLSPVPQNIKLKI